MEFQRLVFHTLDGLIRPTEAPTVLTVARALMRESRYCGNGQHWFPVGLHSFVVADLLPTELKFHGLVHDEPECLTGDIPHDLKTKRQRAFEDMLLERFYRSIDVKPPTHAQHKLIKQADGLAVNAEVWSDCGTHCLQEIYPFSNASGYVEGYRLKYSYADCLDLDGAAVHEFVRRFELYKGYLNG